MQEPDDVIGLQARLAALESENRELRQGLTTVGNPDAKTSDSERAWRDQALAVSGIGLWTWDLVGGGIRWSGHVEKIFGLAPGAFDGTYASYLALIAEEDRAQISAVIEATLAGQGDDYSLRHRVVPPEGEMRWVRCVGRVLRDATGKAHRLVGVVSDITAQVAEEESLRTSRQLLREVLNTIPDFILLLDPQGMIHFVSRTYPDMTEAEILGTDVRKWVLPDHVKTMDEGIARVVQESVQIAIETEGYGPEKRAVHFLTRMAPQTRDGKVVGIVLVGSDITERVQATQSMRENAARLRAAAESLPFSLWVRDAQGRMAIQNRPSMESWGDQIGKRLMDMALPAHLASLAERNLQRVMAGEVVRQEVVANDRVIQAIMAPVRDEGEIIGVVGVDIDLTEERRLKEQLIQSAKTESIGRLAGGVAHDFNNLLTAILGFADIALGLASDPKVSSALTRIREAGRRGAALTQQLLAYARKQPHEPRLLDANEVVRRTARLMSPLLGEAVELQLSLTENLPATEVDPSQFEQILMNLAINARDAMPSGGRLEIITGIEIVDEGMAAKRRDAKPGRHVRIAVKDSGIGMPPEIRDRLFEPFFTTKPVGQGTGLGLASSYGLVHQNGGHLTVESVNGQGSTFTILLPATERAAIKEESGGMRAIADGAGESILLVEDEPLIAEMLMDVLTGLGYRVLCAGDGEEALRVAAAHGGRLDLLITDLVMPRLGGPDLARRLRMRRPGLPVLYISGYSDETTIGGSRLGPGEGFVQKPFSAAVLAERVRELLLPR